MAKLNLDLSGVKAFGSKTVIPSGRYFMKIVQVETKQNKAKTGGYIEMSLEVQEGEQKGSVIIERINIQNSNEIAQRIGLSKLKTILELGGHKNPSKIIDDQEMLGLALDFLVTEENTTWKDDTGETKEGTENVIQGFFKHIEVPNVIEKPVQKAPVKEAVKEEPKAATNAAFPWA